MYNYSDDDILGVKINVNDGVRFDLIDLIKKLRLNYPDYVDIIVLNDKKYSGFFGPLGDLILSDDLWDILQHYKVLCFQPIDLKYVFYIFKESN